jgi:hypothetical protein
VLEMHTSGSLLAQHDGYASHQTKDESSGVLENMLCQR